MKINVLEDSKKKLEFEVEGEDHTLCNALKKELWQDEHVKAATYKIEHPLVSAPRFLVVTDGKESAKEAIVAAATRLKKLNDKFLKSFQKEAK